MTKITNLILIGGGRSCIEIIDLINDINNFKTDKIKIIGILDDDVKLKNRKIYNTKVLGKVSSFTMFKDCHFFLNIHSYKNRFLRLNIIRKLNKIKKRCINLIHPSSLIGINAKLGNGNCIFNNCNIFSGASVGDFNIIMPSVSIASKSKLKINNFIGKNVSIGFNVKIKNNCSIQTNSSILENISLADGIRSMPNSLISGSFSKKNILIGGYPARYIVNEKK